MNTACRDCGSMTDKPLCGECFEAMKAKGSTPYMMTKAAERERELRRNEQPRAVVPEHVRAHWLAELDNILEGVCN